MIDGRQNVNVALKRPSFQVSTWVYGDKTYFASYANDGNRDVRLTEGPCAHTDEAMNPWWAVDLLVALYVAGVKFTNRDHPDTGK